MPNTHPVIFHQHIPVPPLTRLCCLYFTLINSRHGLPLSAQDPPPSAHAYTLLLMSLLPSNFISHLSLKHCHCPSISSRRGPQPSFAIMQVLWRRLASSGAPSLRFRSHLGRTLLRRLPRRPPHHPTRSTQSGWNSLRETNLVHHQLRI